MNDAPRLSVLLAVLNGEAHLDEAICSVLAQTFRDFEFIIIDDGSTDGTARILERFRREDGRIRLYSQPNRGLVTSLNLGMKLAAGEYIARMDADDISLPDRFAAQVAYMDAHKEVGVCGTWVETFGSGRSDIVRYPSDDGTIRSWLLFESAMAHSSVMLRRSTLESHGLVYDIHALHAEDYDLWVRAAHHTILANIPAVFLRYRVHPQQVGSRYEEEMRESAQRIRLAQLDRLGIRPTEEEAKLHETLSRWKFEPTRHFLRAAREWLSKLASANSSVHACPQTNFHFVLGQRWAEVCAAATHEGIRTLVTFWRAPVLAVCGFTWMQHVKFAAKCIIRKHQPVWSNCGHTV